MTKISEEKITCPECGKESPFLIYESINTDLNPELKEKLYTEDSPLIFNCPYCGNRTFVSYDFLYHDMDKRYMIWCVPSGKKPQSPIEEFASAMGKDLANKVIQLSRGYRYRYVRDVDELLEKILELDSPYPDYAWEIVKTLSCLKLNEDLQDRGAHVEQFRFRDIDEEKISSTFLLDDELVSVEIPTDMIQSVTDNFHFPESDECIRVNDEWVANFLQTYRE